MKLGRDIGPVETAVRITGCRDYRFCDYTVGSGDVDACRSAAGAAQRVGGTAMSTRRVAMCAHHILDALVAALRRGVGLRGTLRRGLTFLLANARRSNPDRDRRIGRLRAGLGLVEAA